MTSLALYQLLIHHLAPFKIFGECALEEESAVEIANEEAREEARTALVDEANAMGIDLRIVETLTGEGGLDKANRAQYLGGGVVEILGAVSDPGVKFDHEATHAAVEHGDVTEAEWKVLKDSVSDEVLDATVKQYLDMYVDGKITEDKLIEEAVANSSEGYRNMAPEAKTVMRKLMGWLKKIVRLFKSDAFLNAEEVFGRIRERQQAGAAERLPQAQARRAEIDAAEKGGVTLRRQEVQFSREDFSSLTLDEFLAEKDNPAQELGRDIIYIRDVEVIQNPNATDYKQIKSEANKRGLVGNDPATRFTEDIYGNRWIWASDAGIHSAIEPELERITGRDLNQNNDSFFSRATYRRLKRAAQQAPRFSREAPQAADAARMLAGSIQANPAISAEDMRKMVASIDPELDYQAVSEEAQGILQDAQLAFNKKMHELSRLDISKTAIKRRYQAKGEQVRRQGFVEGRLLEQVRERQAKRAAKVSAKDTRTAKSIGASITDGMVIVGDARESLKLMKANVSSALMDAGLDPKKTFATAYKSAMAKALQGVRRRMKFDGMRESVVTRMNRIKADSTTVARAEALFIETVALEAKQSEKMAMKGLKEQFKKDLDVVKGASNLNTLNINRKVDVDTERYLKLVKAVWGLSKKRAQESLDDLNRTLESAVFNDSDESKSIQAKWERQFPILKSRLWGSTPFSTRMGVLQGVLSRFGGLKSGTLEELAGAATYIEQAILDGRAAAQRNAEQFNATVKNIGGNLKLGTQSRKTKDGKIVRAKDSSGAWTAPFSIFNRLQDFGRFGTERMKKANEKATRLITDLIQRGSTVRDTHTREGLNALADGIVSIYGGTIGGAVRHIERLTRSHKKWAKYNLLTGKNLSAEQMLQIVSIWEQDDIKHNLKGATADYTQDIIDAIKNELDPKDLELLDWLRDFYVEEGRRLSVVSQELFGSDVVAPVENYMPVLADVARLWSSTEVHGAPLTPPTLRDRQVHSRAMDFEHGILSMFEDRLRRNSNFIGYAKTGHILKEVYGNSDLVAQLQLIHGEKSVSALFNHLTDIVTNSKSGMWSSKILNKLRGMVGLTALSGNFKVMFTQVTSAPAFALELGLLDFSKMVAKGLTDPRGYAEGVRVLRESEQWANRKALGTSEFVENALRDNFGSEGIINDMIANDDVKAVARTVSNTIGQLYKKGMVTNALGDATPIFALGPAIYMQNKADALMDGLDEEAATELALERTWGTIQRSQQSYSPKDQSAWIRRGGLLGRMLSQFTTTPAQYLSFEVKALRDIAASENKLTVDNAKKLLNVLAVNHVILPGGYFTLAQFISNMLRGDDPWDEDDTLKLYASMLLGPGSGLIIFGALTQDALEYAFTGKKSVFGGGALPMVETLKRTGLDISDLLKHMTYDFDFDEALKDTDEVMRDFSAPFRQASQIEERINN